MANTFLNTGRTVVATNNPQRNVEQVQNNTVQAVPQNNAVANTVPSTQSTQQTSNNAINPITIPIQIQPQIASTGQPQTTQANVQPLQTGQNNTNVQTGNQAPTPQQYQGNNTNNNVIDFNQIYSTYQGQYGNNNSNTSNTTTSSGIKKSSIGTTIVTPTNTNINTVQGQYQSAYSDTINSLIGSMLERLETGFQYDPASDTALQAATEYAANSTLQSLAGSGVLNSSSTAERVAKVVSDLIPQYEQLAYTRWTDYLGQLADTAQMVMNYDSQQFQYWKDAKDREFQEKQFEYQKQQDALDNAWKRVDELGYVDNEASTILGVPVGTLSGEARLAKEQREFELAKMREQAQIEFENNKALYQLKSELDKEQQLYASQLEKEQMQYQSQLEKEQQDYAYQLQQKYGVSSSSKTDTTNLSTYQDIIDTRWVTKDDFTDEITNVNKDDIYNFIKSENQAGRMKDNDAYALLAKYDINPSSMGTLVSMKGNTIYIRKNGQTSSFTIASGASREQILAWGNQRGVDLSSYI